MGSHFRQVILALARWAGVIRLLQFIHRNQIVIWMAHGVMDDRDHPVWEPLRPQLSRAKLDEYLRMLSRRYHFVSLAEAVEMLQGRKPMQPYSMVLTFDDGYRNNVTHALPILRRYGVPATFFVTTGFVDHPRPLWFDRLDYALQQVQVHGREVKVGSFRMRLEGQSREALRESYQRLRRIGKEQHITDAEFLHEMEQLASCLETQSGHALADIQSQDDWSAFLTWKQIRQAAEDDVTFGSHTVDHVRLALVEAQVARDQLVRSKRDLETHTGGSCLSICYPNGSFDEQTVRIARESSYVCGLTTQEGFNCIGDDVMTLKRVSLGADLRRTDLLARASGLSSLTTRIRSCRLVRLLTAPAYVCRLVRSHGIRKAVARLSKEVYSNTDYVMTRRRLDSLRDTGSPQANFRFELLEEEDVKGVEDVCRVWPADWRSKHLKTKVMDDLRRGDACLLLRAESEGTVLGAIWLSPSDEIINHCGVPHDAREGMIRSFFVVPHARGRGLSKLLLSRIAAVARERGMFQIFGYVLPYRKASIRAQLSAGFQIIGTMRVRTRVGRTRYTFVPSMEMNHQPTDPAQADPALRL